MILFTSQFGVLKYLIQLKFTFCVSSNLIENFLIASENVRNAFEMQKNIENVKVKLNGTKEKSNLKLLRGQTCFLVLKYFEKSIHKN